MLVVQTDLQCAQKKRPLVHHPKYVSYRDSCLPTAMGPSPSIAGYPDDLKRIPN